MNTEPRDVPFKTVFDTRAGQKWFSIVVAIIPASLFVFLALVNPTYMAHFFLAEVRVAGLSILGLVALLSVLSFLLMRRCTSVIRSGKRLRGLVLATLVMVLVTFPAVLLVLLGPAALMLFSADLL